MSTAVIDYTQQSEMTRINKSINLPIVSGVEEIAKKYRPLKETMSLDTFISALGDIGKLERELKEAEVNGNDRHYIYTIDHIFSEGIHPYFDHDETIVTVSILREMGIPASYAFLAMKENNKILPRSAPIADLGEKGRWVIFGTNPIQITEFNERIGNYEFVGEGYDPKSMNVSDLNTFLGWREDKIREYLGSKGYEIYHGVYSREIRIIAGNHIFDLPEETQNSLSVRNGGIHTLCLEERIDHTPKGIVKNITAYDEKAAKERDLSQRPRDARVAHKVVVTDGHFIVPETFYKALYGEQFSIKDRDPFNPTQGLEPLIVESSEDGEFFRIWGYSEYFKYSKEMERVNELKRDYSFKSMTRIGMHSMDGKTRVKWHVDFAGYILTRHGILNGDQYMSIPQEGIIKLYKKHPEIFLYFKHSGFDNQGNLLLEVMDMPPPDDQKGQYWAASLDHSIRTIFGKRIFLFDDGDLFREKSLDLDLIGENNSKFTLKIRKPK